MCVRATAHTERHMPSRVFVEAERALVYPEKEAFTKFRRNLGIKALDTTVEDAIPTKNTQTKPLEVPLKIHGAFHDLPSDENQKEKTNSTLNSQPLTGGPPKEDL